MVTQAQARCEAGPPTPEVGQNVRKTSELTELELTYL